MGKPPYFHNAAHSMCTERGDGAAKPRPIPLTLWGRGRGGGSIWGSPPHFRVSWQDTINLSFHNAAHMMCTGRGDGAAKPRPIPLTLWGRGRGGGSIWGSSPIFAFRGQDTINLSFHNAAHMMCTGRSDGAAKPRPIPLTLWGRSGATGAAYGEAPFSVFRGQDTINLSKRLDFFRKTW